MAKYNKELNCVYIDVPRTGCGSISAVIGGGGHQPVSVMKDVVKEKGGDWDSLFKFAFVRNPFDRFVSAFHNLHLEERFDINDFVKDDEETMQREWILFRPQVDWLVENGDIQVDFIGRFEDMKRDWNHIQKRLGIKESLPHANKTTVKKAILSDECKDMLVELYKEDFGTFGYANN